MRDNSQNSARTARRSDLFTYNVRILLGNTYWLIVTPVAATQLVLFWNMATATLFSATRAAQTIELLAPILGAFLCAHALAPEQDGVGELVFVRPVSFEKILPLRLAAMLVFVLAVMVPAFVIYHVGIDDFPLCLTVLASLPSMLFLSVFAMAVASATRHPLVGLGAAGAFWVLDLTIGGYFNPLVSLHGFADYLANQPMAEQWIVSKLVLIGLAALLYLWHRSILGRPAAPRRWTALARTFLLVLVLLFGYVATGAAYKAVYGMHHEAQLGHRARLWYQRQFRGYGPLPVAWMFGPAFPLYVQADVGRDLSFAGRGTGSLWAPVDVSRMSMLLNRYPDSMWADNAQFEIATYATRQRTSEAWLVVSYRVDHPEATRRVVSEDLERAAQEFETLVDRYPDSAFAPLALSERALIGLTLLDFEMARDSCQRLLWEHPRAPQVYDAGVRLSALYLREGKPVEARKAADLAAAVAPWDVRAEALLAAARAAQQAGEKDIARDRYQRARDAAEEAVERAVRGEARPTVRAKGALFDRSNATMDAARQALARSLAPSPAAPVSTTEVTGRILRGESGAPGIRVALGASASAGGLPSPFQEGPAFRATTGPEGVFRLNSVRPGEYTVAAFAMRVPEDEPGLTVERPPLPVRVQNSPVAIPDLSLSSAPPAAVQRTPPARPPEASPGSRRNGRRFDGVRSLRPRGDRGSSRRSGPRSRSRPRGGRR